MSETYDVAILGSGFAGSLLAMIATRLGHSVILIERGRHPRFAIGESSTPLCNLLLEELSTRYDLTAVKPLAKWGSWQREYPEVGCGLKRGFSFFHHDLKPRVTKPIDWDDQMLVAASPHDELADTHWFRADFDQLLVRQAQKLGVVYQDEVDLRHFREDDDFVELSGVRHDCAVQFGARFVVDATGPRGCLHRLLEIDETTVSGYPRTQALYSHFSGVKHLAKGSWLERNESAPYPIDDAAVHHVFDGGWIWVLRFNNGLTSAGVAVKDAAAQHLNLASGEPAWQRLLDRVPTLKGQFENAAVERPFQHATNLCFRSAQVAGNRWAMLPSAAGFVDPLLSTGFPLTLLGVKRIAELLEAYWQTTHFEQALRDYAEATDAEFLQTANLIAALYANMNNFPVFRALSLLYFAAASYSETVKRLGKPHLAKSFLLHDLPSFGPASGRLFAKAAEGIPTTDTVAFIREVKAIIEPIDVAGLTKSHARHHYPVDANDMLANAWKVDSNREEIVQMLERSGFYATTTA